MVWQSGFKLSLKGWQIGTRRMSESITCERCHILNSRPEDVQKSNNIYNMQKLRQYQSGEKVKKDNATY